MTMIRLTAKDLGALIPLLLGGDFAEGMRTLPCNPRVGSFATGMRATD